MSYTKKEFLALDPDFKIGAIISDGMWYSFTKWRDMAGVTEEQLSKWIEERLSTGELIQSDTGAKSYRFPLSSMRKWYKDHGLDIEKDQLLSFVFPPRIWDNKSETEGFLSAPLRKIGIVSFNCSSDIAEDIKKDLLGIARVREADPGKYKAYCLNASYVKKIVEDSFRRHGKEPDKVYSLAVAKRREMVDFSPEFAKGLVFFYKEFGKSLVKNEMETIKIFLKDKDEQETQILLWVLQAIEKFDESASVPFSGYFNTVIHRWPYDLPSTFLGKELSNFQRNRSKALKSLQKRYKRDNFKTEEIIEEMGISRNEFKDLDEKHKIWTKTQNTTHLTWDHTTDEKGIEGSVFGSHNSSVEDIRLANTISVAVIRAAISTGLYQDAFTIAGQIDAKELDKNSINSVSEDFVKELAKNLSLTD